MRMNFKNCLPILDSEFLNCTVEVISESFSLEDGLAITSLFQKKCMYTFISGSNIWYVHAVHCIPSLVYLSNNIVV